MIRTRFSFLNPKRNFFKSLRSKH